MDRRRGRRSFSRSGNSRQERSPVNIVLALWHSIEEFDQVRLLSSLGYNVHSIGAYSDPANPGDDKRPALPDVPYFAELHAATNRSHEQGIEPKQALPPELLDWADTIIYHHRLPDLYGQWDERIAPWLAGGSHRRIIWRTVGQSVTNNEREAAPFRERGLEIVRYSPKERNIPGYVGEDALIRFYKDPADYGGWTGEEAVVINVTQHLRQRDPYTNWGFWEAATEGLPRMPLGPGSEVIGGPGALSYDDMLRALQVARCYLYPGTQPASYTLGLIEAMMTGIPVVSIGPGWMNVFPYGPDLFEGHEIVGQTAENGWRYDEELAEARGALELYLKSDLDAELAGDLMREEAIRTFGRDKIAAEWKAYLG